jgi:hypothetical protein
MKRSAPTRQNMWPFSASRKVPSKPSRRSSMTISQATHAAYRAGKQSGDTGLFNEWAESKGLQGRGSSLRASYEAGVTGQVSKGAPSWLKSIAGSSDRPTVAKYATVDTKKIFRDVQYKGFRIYPSGSGFKTSPGDGTEFEDVKEAKRFVDDEVKMGRNPAKFDRCVKAVKRKGGGVNAYAVCTAAGTRNPAGVSIVPSARRSGMWDVFINGILRVTKPTRKGAEGYAKRWEDENAPLKRNRVAANPRRRKNSPEAADRMYEKFHGKKPDGAIIVEEEEHVHENLSVLGQLIEMRIDTVTGICACLSFEDDPPFLCSSEDGQQLYIEAGDQILDLDTLGFDDPKWMKDRMVIGRFSPPDGPKEKWNIGYQTEKDFDGFETILYQHDLGEETSLNGKIRRIPEEDRVRPMLEYEPKNQKLFITGGQYTINLPLIGTSPGIEN